MAIPLITELIVKLLLHMPERELSLDEKKAILKILLIDAMKVLRTMRLLIKESAQINWRTDRERYDQNHQETNRLDAIRLKKIYEAESIFLSLTKKERDEFLLELKPHLLDAEECEHVKSAMEWNAPETRAKTISHTETCELLGKAIREKWTDEMLLKKFRALIKQKWGEEALKGARIVTTVKPPKLFYQGEGPGISVGENEIKEDGSMYTPEEIAARIEKILRGGKKEEKN